MRWVDEGLHRFFNKFNPMLILWFFESSQIISICFSDILKSLPLITIVKTGFILRDYSKFSNDSIVVFDLNVSCGW